MYYLYALEEANVKCKKHVNSLYKIYINLAIFIKKIDFEQNVIVLDRWSVHLAKCIIA